MQIFKDVYMVAGDDYSVSGTEWPHGDCCCYVIDTGRGLLFFDTGFEETLPEKLEVFRYWGLDPDDVRYVFISHGHLDHFTAAKHFQDRGAQIVSGAYTADLMANGNGDGPDRLALWAFREPEPTPRFIPCKPDIVVDNNDTRDYLGVTVKSIHTAGPGHHHMLGSDGVSLYLATFGPRNILFSGDHILFDRYGHISWSSKEDLPLFDALKAHKIDAILGGHYFLHWRPWPRKCPA